MSARILGTEIRFDAPWALALLALVVVAAALELRRERGRGGGVLFSSLGLVPRARGSWRVRLRWLLLPLRVVAATALILALAAPSVVQAALDVPADRHERLGAQAAKFTTGELSRIVSLLLAAQTDMRWTASPRLTLEVALVRATMPGADPNPGGLGARIERLERLAGVEGSVGAAEVGGPVGATEHLEAAATATGSDSADADTQATAVPEPAQPHAPSAGSLDLLAIRRAWPQLLERLLERRQMILRANLESVTAAAYDGAILELAFPPGRKFAVQKVQSKEGDLREAFADVFGVSPRIQCVARDGVPGMAMVEEDDPPAGPEDALARLKAEFGAEVEESPPAEQGD